MLFEIDFEYRVSENPKIYKARGQIKKGKTYTRGENDIEINIGEAGDAFPCIMLKYSFSTNTFNIEKIRKVAWGGYKSDEPVLCISPPLPEKNSLDLLIYLSLAIIYKIIEVNKLDKLNKSKPYISIIDNAFIDNYPFSWLKFKLGSSTLNNNYNRKTVYGKFGFQLRSPNEENKFEEYIEEQVPRYLNYTLEKIILDSKNSDLKQDFFKELDKINSILSTKKKNIPKLKYIPKETLGVFIEKVFKTGLREDYEELLKTLNRKYKYDIRGLWYLDKELMGPEMVDSKVKILDFRV